MDYGYIPKQLQIVVEHGDPTCLIQENVNDVDSDIIWVAPQNIPKLIELLQGAYDEWKSSQE